MIFKLIGRIISYKIDFKANHFINIILTMSYALLPFRNGQGRLQSTTAFEPHATRLAPRAQHGRESGPVHARHEHHQRGVQAHQALGLQ